MGRIRGLAAGLGMATLMVIGAACQSGSAVLLTEVQGLPSFVAIGQENEVGFRIQAGQQISDATLWVQLRAEGVTLHDPNIAQVSYRHPNDDSFKSIPLRPDDGKLKGTLEAGWEIPEDYDGNGEIRITFLPNAPAMSFYVDLGVSNTKS